MSAGTNPTIAEMVEAVKFEVDHWEDFQEEIADSERWLKHFAALKAALATLSSLSPLIEVAHNLAGEVVLMLEKGIALPREVEQALDKMGNALSTFPAPAPASLWRPLDATIEHERRVLATDGNRCAVVYLSKWSSLWYFDANSKGCSWKLTHYMPLPAPPSTSDGGE